jgi:hypothetical protein
MHRASAIRRARLSADQRKLAISIGLERSRAFRIAGMRTIDTPSSSEDGARCAKALVSTVGS